MIEFLIMIPFALVIILGAIQMALIFNAHTMLKLAAFNAARAAIVAQGDKPQDPATVANTSGFLRPAHLAAVLTLLPVIPPLHGTQATFGSIQNLVQNANLGTATAVVEAAFINVEFLAPDSALADPITGTRSPGIGNWPNRIDFDDHKRPAENVIKVRVHWDYPLVIPFINRILAAIGNPALYVAYKVALANGQQLTPLQLFNELNKPAWAYADFLGSQVTGNAQLDLALNNLLLRWPMNASYIMRMQWDRKPN